MLLTFLMSLLLLAQVLATPSHEQQQYTTELRTPNSTDLRTRTWHWGASRPTFAAAAKAAKAPLMEDERPRQWHAGVRCLDETRQLFFTRRELLTRSPNLMLTSAVNMSTPAAQIQEAFLKLVHEAVSEEPLRSRYVYQLRVVSNWRGKYMRSVTYGSELLYADYYVLVVDTVQRLEMLMSQYVSLTLSWNPGARFLILYNNETERKSGEAVALRIFGTMLDLYNVQRVALLFATGDVDYVLMGMDYYSTTDCRNMHVREIANCHDGELQSQSPSLFGRLGIELAMREYYAHINMANCTLNVCCSIAAPFVEEDCLSGLEMRIINFIKNRLKFQLNMTCLRESRGVQLESGEWTGLLSKLVGRDCDFILGGFYPDNDVADVFWTSDSYLTDAHTFFVKLADSKPPWLALYSIFEHSTWLCMVIMLLFNWFCWWCFVNALPEPVGDREPSLTAINTLAVTICVSVNERPICGASRIYFFWLALYGINLTATYTSNLIVVLSDPGKMHQIDTISEVVEAGIPFGGNAESSDWFENDDDMWIYHLYNDSYEFEPQPENLLAVKRGERVILSSRMFVLQNEYSDQLYAFKSNIFSSPLQMIMRPGFPFLADFNWMIRNMRDSGFFMRINNNFRYNNSYINRIAKMRPEFKDSAIVLTVAHLQGPFAVLIVGISASTLAFIGELFIFWLVDPCLNHCFGWTFSKRNKSKKPSQPKNKPKKQKKHSKFSKTKHRRLMSSSVGRVLKWMFSSKGNKTKYDQGEHKDEQDISTPVYEMNIIHSVRFTPLKRRQIIHK